MKIIRLQHNRLVLAICCILLVMLILHFLFATESESEHCTVTKKVHQKMKLILQRTEEAMNALQLTYFLCYESLWGALKIEGPLPWQNKIQLCVLNEELNTVDEGFLVRTFKRYRLHITYNSADGTYHITLLNDYSSEVTLIVFEKDSITHQMRRVGWKNRLLPPGACDLLHCFPPRLLSPPLPQINFFSMKLPVAREEIEIQKYLFPNSWWKDIVPDKCKQRLNIHWVCIVVNENKG